MASEPDEAELWRRAFESRTLDFHTSLPAIVDTYDRSKQTVDVKVAVKRGIRSDTEPTVYEELPLLRNVRVKFPKGSINGNKFFMVWPLSPGDPVDVVFDEQYAGEYRETGTVPSEPKFIGRFNLSSAYAIPGGGANSDAVQDLGPATAMVLGMENGPQIRIWKTGDDDSPHIDLGHNVTSFAGHADKIALVFNNMLAALQTAFASATPTEVGFKAFAVALHALYGIPIQAADVGATVVFVE